MAFVLYVLRYDHSEIQKNRILLRVQAGSSLSILLSLIVYYYYLSYFLLCLPYLITYLSSPHFLPFIANGPFSELEEER